MRDKIKDFQTKLNHSDIVPERCYRRNSPHYRSMCYVNNISGLFISSNFDAIPIFVDRAYKEIQTIKKIFNKNGTEMPPYYSLVLEYLVLMAEFCNLLGSIPEGLISRIPKDLLQGKTDIEPKDYS